MPSITIREKDLTSAGNLEVTTNAVYIPGYANMGPINTPTLCNTLEDFQQIFGSEPYRFMHDQKWDFSNHKWKTGGNSVNDDMGNFYNEGDPEKSYIIAYELLKLGLPVLYERVFMKKDAKGNLDTSSWKAKANHSNQLTITAVSPGVVSSDIWFYIQKKSASLGQNNNKDYFTIVVGRVANSQRGTSQIDAVETDVTFDKDLAKEYSSIKLIRQNETFVDNGNLVEIEVIGCNLQESGKDTDGEFIQNRLALTVSKDGTNEEFTVSDMYSYLSTNGVNNTTQEVEGFERLVDNGEYVIKFITSGAYPVYEYDDNVIAKVMVETAATKGNCTAILDHTPNNTRSLQALNTNSVYYTIANDFGKVVRKNKLGEDAHTYAAMFTPYGIYECGSVAQDVMLPASFGYLAAYAVQVQQYNGWLATAGCTRGLVPNLKSLCQNVTNAIADSYQPRNGIAINAITNIKPYGLTIWGARTLKDNSKKGDLTATSFLNIRQLTNDVKRTTWVAAKTLTYEQNNDMLWIKFKMNITPLLNQMISGSAISAYEFKRQATTKKATVNAVIRLYAIEPVEDWDITIELADSSTEIIG